MSTDSETTAELPSASSPGKPRRWRRRLVRLARLAALAYLALLCLTIFGQRWAIFPGTIVTSPRIKASVIADSEPFTVNLPDGTPIAGLFCRTRTPAPGPGKPPTILYFYGNASSVSHSRIEVDLFRECGANVMLVDYPGYGLSAGSASEQSFYQAASALWDYAAAHPEVDNRRIVIAGWSLGGAVAVDLTSRRPAAGLMTVSTFTSMDEMAHFRLPFMPTSLILRYHFTSIRKLAGLRVPLIVAHGDDDYNVPFAMAKRLCAAAPFSPDVQYVPIASADHIDIFTVGHDQLTAALRQLLSRVIQASP